MSSIFSIESRKEERKLKFMKGMLIGGIVTAGVAMIYAETMGQGKKKMMKKGKQFAKRMGIM